MSKKVNNNRAKVDAGGYVRVFFCDAVTLEGREQELRSFGENFAKCAGNKGGAGATIASMKPDAHAQDGVYCVKISGKLSPAQATILQEYRYS